MAIATFLHQLHQLNGAHSHFTPNSKLYQNGSKPSPHATVQGPLSSIYARRREWRDVTPSVETRHTGCTLTMTPMTLGSPLMQVRYPVGAIFFLFMFCLFTTWKIWRSEKCFILYRRSICFTKQILISNGFACLTYVYMMTSRVDNAGETLNLTI